MKEGPAVPPISMIVGSILRLAKASAQNKPANPAPMIVKSVFVKVAGSHFRLNNLLTFPFSFQNQAFSWF